MLSLFFHAQRPRLTYPTRLPSLRRPVGTTREEVDPASCRCPLPFPFFRAALFPGGQSATLPVECAGPAKSASADLGRALLRDRPTEGVSGLMPQASPQGPLGCLHKRVGDTCGCSSRARVYPPSAGQARGASGPALRPWVPPGTLTALDRRGGGVVEALSWTLVQAPAAPCRMCRKEIEPRGGP